SSPCFICLLQQPTLYRLAPQLLRLHLLHLDFLVSNSICKIMRQIALLLSLLFLFLLCFSRQHKPADSNRSSQNISSNHRINDSLHSMRKSADSIQQLQDTTQSKGLKSYVKEIEHELSVHLLGHALWFLIGLIATFLFLRTKKLIVKSRYRKVFGNDIKNFTIVYP